MSLREEMAAVYGELARSEIPWNLEVPPALLRRFVAREKTHCPVVDLGCGAGNHAVWLAGLGFEVTGIDLSPEAIRLAEELAAEKGVRCRFLVQDLLESLALPAGSFDLAYDWLALHHVPPGLRESYTGNVHRLLRPGGRYLSVSFALDHPGFGGQGAVRQTVLGTTLYFSTPEQIRELFEPSFEVESIGTEEIPAREGTHHVVVARLRR